MVSFGSARCGGQSVLCLLLVSLTIISFLNPAAAAGSHAAVVSVSDHGGGNSTTSTATATTTTTTTDDAGLEHGYDTVNDMMWGWLSAPFEDSVTEFFAKTYSLVVVTSGSRIDFLNATAVQDWDLWATARKLRALNPKIKILLYEATQWGVLALGPTQLQEHPDWWLRDDRGVAYMSGNRPTTLDPRVPAAREWWITSITQAHVAGSNDTVHLVDGLLVDSASADMAVPFNDTNHTMSAANVRAVIQAKMDMLGQARDYFHNLNGGGVLANPLLDWGVVGNPAEQDVRDFPITYHWDYVNGALDEMFGGFGSLQSPQSSGGAAGHWNASTMNISINAILNMSGDASAGGREQVVLVRGYPGPCGVPFVTIPVPTAPQVPDVVIPSWPANYSRAQPTTLTAAVAAMEDEQLITQALAPFLITAGARVWWSYAWFYSSFSGWFPCSDMSCVGPKTWYPMFSKAVGAPLGPATCDGGYKWTRKFEHCDVSVDLEDQEACSIVWH